MKFLNLLSTLLLITATEAYSANSPSFLESESFIKSRPANSKNNRKNKHEKQENPTQIAGSKGEKGDKGDSVSVIHGYYSKSSNDEVATKSPVIFESINVETGNLSYDEASGTLTFPEEGNYQVSYFIDALANNTHVVAIQLNDEILSESKHKSNGAQNGQINATLIIKAKKEDQLKVVNLSDEPLQFDNADFSTVNASLTIKKLD